MSSNLEAKKQIVDEIKDKIQRAKTVAFVDYRGLTVEDDTKMRAKFRAVNSEYKVYKNRLVMKALDELGITGINLEGTNAVAFGYEDEVNAPKVIVESAKGTNKLEIVCGIMNGKKVEKAEIEKYAALPTKEVLIAQLLSMLNAPVRGLAVALNAIAEKN